MTIDLSIQYVQIVPRLARLYAVPLHASANNAQCRPTEAYPAA